jgi:hypothetical protein
MPTAQEYALLPVRAAHLDRTQQPPVWVLVLLVMLTVMFAWRFVPTVNTVKTMSAFHHVKSQATSRPI